MMKVVVLLYLLFTAHCNAIQYPNSFQQIKHNLPSIEDIKKQAVEHAQYAKEMYESISEQITPSVKNAGAFVQQTVIQQVNNLPSMEEINKQAAEHAQYAKQMYENVKAQAEANIPPAFEKGKNFVSSHVSNAAEIIVQQVNNLPSMEEINKQAAEHAQYAKQMYENIKAQAETHLPPAFEKGKNFVSSHVSDAAEVIIQQVNNLPSMEEINKQAAEHAQYAKQMYENIKAQAEANIPPAFEKGKNFVSSHVSDAAEIISSYLSALHNPESTVLQVAAECVHWPAEKLANHLGISQEAAEKVVKITVGVAAGAAVAYLVVPGILPVIGFTEEGVRYGSLAAYVQSVFYAGKTTGVFSALQSAGVLGVEDSTAFIIYSALGGATAYAASTTVDTHDDQVEGSS